MPGSAARFGGPAGRAAISARSPGARGSGKPAGTTHVGEKSLRRVGDPRNVEPVLRVERLAAAGLAEVEHRVTPHRDAALGDRFAHGAPEATDDTVVLDRDDSAAAYRSASGCGCSGQRPPRRAPRA